MEARAGSGMRIVGLVMMLACAREQTPTLRTQGLVGDGVVGLIRAAEGGCGGGGPTVGLWGPTWGTDGEVPAEAIEEQPGVVWLWFPLETGLGEGQAALRLEGEQVRLPLGARRGEFDVLLRPTDGLPDGLTEAAAAAATALERERLAWAEGRFLLLDGAEVVGDLQLRGEAPPLIAVYDAGWLTPERVSARRADEGADLLLSFPVEPSFQAEEAQIRVNVPTRDVVVPAGSAPTDLDRRLRLEPGTMDAERRANAIATARERSRALENAETSALAARLARAAASEHGCLPLSALDPSWALLLRGYRVHIAEASVPGRDLRCVVEIEPEIIQHGRELRGRFGSDE